MQLNNNWPQGFMLYIREELKGSRMSPLDVVIAVKELAGLTPTARRPLSRSHTSCPGPSWTSRVSQTPS